MSLYSVFDLAGSAMSAQSLRLNTTASNMANADTISSSIDKTYRARHPVFRTVFDQTLADQGYEVGGVKVAGIVESNAPLRKEYHPEHPMADKDGYVYSPNVNLIEEMANMISASRSYQTNIEVMNASKQMLLHTISLGQ